MIRHINSTDSNQNFSELTLSILNKDVDISIKSMFPEYLRSYKDYNIILDIISYEVSNTLSNINNIVNSYSLDYNSDVNLFRILDTLNIKLPFEIHNNIAKNMLKYFLYIRRNRGTVNAIKLLLKILFTRDSDISSLNMLNFNDIDIVKIRDGDYVVKYDRITDLNLANDLIKKVTPAGTSIRCSHKFNSNKILFDTSNGLETFVIDRW